MISTKISLIDYEQLVQDSLKGVIRHVLTNTAKNGLIGSHHFYISFATQFPGVDMPDYLRHEYPEEITVVLQHEYWDLEVETQNFSVTLCFNEIHERLTIPFDAIVSFVDPSVKFGLQFTPTIHERPKKARKVKESTPRITKSKKAKTIAPQEIPAAGSNVIALDTFRKKK